MDRNASPKQHKRLGTSHAEGREQVVSILAQKVVQAITLACLGKKIPQTKYTGSKMLERALCN